MKKELKLGFAALGLVLFTASIASACHVSGYVKCSPTGAGLPGVTVSFVATTGDPYSGSIVTDADGYYNMALPIVIACYDIFVTLGPGQTYVDPPTGHQDFCIPDVEPSYTLGDILITDPSCAPTPGTCWLTGGGAKFSSIVGLYLGENGKKHNWGGNVYPGCSSTAGDGGSWNHIDTAQKLHFHGQQIEVVECGNVDGIPPGSTSPSTPFNYIEFKGTGTLKGIQGNKADYGTVFFYARAEDRNEPGSTGQRDGAGKDRYFLNVYTDELDPVGSSVILVDMDGDPATVDPLIITDGNMQIHDTSCDTPAIVSTTTRAKSAAAAATESKTWGELKSTYK
jgi:hypothetical protein